MTISKRLKTSYILLVLIPFILFLFASFFIRDEYMTRIHDLKLSIQTETFNTALYTTLGNNPNALLTKEKLNYLISLTTAPEEMTSFITIEGEIVITVGEDLNNIKDKIHEQKYINYWIFNLNDGRTATIFVINHDFRNAAASFAFIFPIFFYILLISLLSFITSRKITRPLKKLKYAAISIKEEEFDVDMHYNGNDEIKDVFIAFDDMRVKLKQNVEKQLRYERSRTELIANISHDLKTPITAIKGYIEGIVDGVANTPEKISRYHQTIYKKVNILDKLIDNLFINSKLELKTVPFHFQKLNLDLFLTDFIEEVKYDIPEIDMDLDIIDYDLFISGDPIQLQRVMHNIIGNSLKYCDKQVCKIYIKLIKEGDFIRVSIEDNGVGISQNSARDIFKQFFRSDPARSSTTEGSGLGLAISKQIITEHRGEIFAKNNLKDGLTVIFILPILKSGRN